MLKTSLYTSFFAIISIYCLFFSTFRINIKNKLDFFVETWLVVLRLLLALTSSLYLKKVMCDFLEVQDDSHVWDILYSKVSDYKTFHTLIYTCSAVFDYLPLKSVQNMSKSMLIPFVLLICVNVVSYWFSSAISKCKKEIDDLVKEEEEEGDDDDSGIENNSETMKNKPRKDVDVILSSFDGKMKKLDEMKNVGMFLLKNMNIEPAIFYNLSQMFVFGVMAALVMRLKLLFSTQMCLVCSLIANRNYNM